MKFILRNIGGSLINPIDIYPNGVYNENTLRGYAKKGGNIMLSLVVNV